MSLNQNQNLVAIFFTFLEHFAVFFVCFFFERQKLKKTKTLCPVYVLNSDTRVHFNCIIFSCTDGRATLRSSLSCSGRAVACLSLCTDRNSPPWRKIREIRPGVTPFATFSHLTLSGGNICALHAIHHRCIWQTRLARKRSNTWAAFLNLSALGKKWNLNGEKGFQQATPAGTD